MQVITYLVVVVGDVVLPRTTGGHSPDLHTDCRWVDHQNAGMRDHQSHCSAAGKMVLTLAAKTGEERKITC